MASSLSCQSRIDFSAESGPPAVLGPGIRCLGPSPWLRYPGVCQSPRHPGATFCAPGHPGSPSLPRSRPGQSPALPGVSVSRLPRLGAGLRLGALARTCRLRRRSRPGARRLRPLRVLLAPFALVPVPRDLRRRAEAPRNGQGPAGPASPRGPRERPARGAALQPAARRSARGGLRRAGAAGPHQRRAGLPAGLPLTAKARRSTPLAPQRWQRGLRGSAVGPRHHGRPGTGLQGRGRRGSDGRHQQGVVVGPWGRWRGLVSSRLRAAAGEPGRALGRRGAAARRRRGGGRRGGRAEQQQGPDAHQRHPGDPQHRARLHQAPARHLRGLHQAVSQARRHVQRGAAAHHLRQHRGHLPLPHGLRAGAGAEVQPRAPAPERAGRLLPGAPSTLPDLLRLLQQPPQRLPGALPARQTQQVHLLLRGLPAAAEDDRHLAGRLPADAGAEDLPVPAAAGRAAQVHAPPAPGFQRRGSCLRGHEEGGPAHQRAEAQAGEHRQDRSVAELRGGLGGGRPAGPELGTHPLGGADAGHTATRQEPAEDVLSLRPPAHLLQEGPSPPGRAVLQGPGGPGRPGSGGRGGLQGQGPARERQARLPAALQHSGREPPAVCQEAGAEAALAAGLRPGEGAGAAGPGDRLLHHRGAEEAGHAEGQQAAGGWEAQSPRPALLPDAPEAPGTVHQPAPAAGPGVGRAQAEAVYLLAQPQPAGPLPQVSLRPQPHCLDLLCRLPPALPTPRPLPSLQAASEQG